MSQIKGGGKVAKYPPNGGPGGGGVGNPNSQIQETQVPIITITKKTIPLHIIV